MLSEQLVFIVTFNAMNDHSSLLHLDVCVSVCAFSFAILLLRVQWMDTTWGGHPAEASVSFPRLMRI